MSPPGELQSIIFLYRDAGRALEYEVYSWAEHIAAHARRCARLLFAVGSRFDSHSVACLVSDAGGCLASADFNIMALLLKCDDGFFGFRQGVGPYSASAPWRSGQRHRRR